jgi:hypothetical protein
LKFEIWRWPLLCYRLPLADFPASYVIDSGGISKKGAMSDLRQRLLPIARQPLALMSVLRSFRASVEKRVGALAEQPGVRRTLTRLLAVYAAILRRAVERWKGEPGIGPAGEPVAGALVKISEGSRALMALPVKGRALVNLVPAPVQVELKKLSSGGAHVCREIFAGILVVGLIVIVGGYGRLARGPISLPSLVPMIEHAINGELSDLHVEIDDAILQRSPDGPGVLFRLRNIRLIDTNGSIVAQAPLAAIGMSGAALLSGRIAPGSVDFIGPKLLFYAADNGLSLSFYRPTSNDVGKFIKGNRAAGIPAVPAAEPGAEGGSVVAMRPEATAGAGRKLDVTRTVTEVFERARRGNTSYLTRFGVKDAQVVLSRDGVETQLQVPDFSIDLRHMDQRSVLVGQANLGSSKGDWQLEFRTEERPKRESLSITALIQNLVPSGLAENFPAAAGLKALDLPVSGETSVELSTAGRFLSGEANLQLQPGQITPPWDTKNAMKIDGGNLRVRYAKTNDVFEIEPSKLKWGESQATISGEFRPAGNDNGFPSWTFKLRATDALLAAAEFGVAPVKVDEWSAEGTVAPEGGRMTLSRFVIRSGAASIELAGSVVDAPGSPEVHLTGVVSPMPLDVLKQFWPKFLAGDARKWVGQNVRGGQVLGGKVAISLQPGELARMEAGVELAPEAANVELDLADMSITYVGKLPPILTGNATLRVVGTAFSVDIPEGKVVLPSGQEIALSEGRFFIPDLRPDPQQGQVTFNANGATTTVMQLLDHEPLGYMQAVGMKPESFGGTAAGSFALDMPMREDLEFKDIKLRSETHLDQAIASSVVGNIDVEGGALDVNVTEQGLDVRGQILIKGVPAELAWQRIFYEPDERQPPIRISATLDENARESLGLKISHLLHGPLPVTLSVVRNAQGAQALSMQADLTKAQLVFGNMGWTKPPGRSAAMRFDIAQGKDGSTDLKNLKIVGDDIAIDGTISLDPEQHLKGFYFSDFSFDMLTHVEISATVHDGSVLEVDAHGPSYDGKQFFQSLFSAGQLAEDSEPHDPFSVDLTARFGTVVGFYDTTVNDVQVDLKKQNGRLVALNATGKLNGRMPLAVKLDETNGARIIHAESRDAGAAFRLIGFYPKVDGGEASLEVNLDTSEPGMKTGTLWARSFAVLGDSVVSDVLTDPQSMAALGERKKQVRQTRIGFDQLRAPFAVGKGQFLLNDAYVNGPALGATMRGRVDFKAQTVNLGGTYVPLYGLNSALGNIPILGGIFVGRQGEGVVGITFAIQGQLDDPNVLVNPISVVAPGIFRQIFEFRGEGHNAASTTTAPSTFGDAAR